MSRDREAPARFAAGGGSGARDRILAAAERLFARHGYGGTATKAVAEEAGVAVGLVFYHFPTKRQLFESVLDERGLIPTARTVLASADRSDPVGGLTAAGECFRNALRQHRNLVRILLQADRTETAGWDQLQDVLRSEVVAVSDYLVAALGPERLDGRRARTLAHTYLGAIVFRELVLVPIDADADLHELAAGLLAAFS